MDDKLVFEALRRGIITPEEAKQRISDDSPIIPPLLPGNNDGGGNPPPAPSGGSYEISDVAKGLYDKAKSAASYAINNPAEAAQSFSQHGDQIMSDLKNHPLDVAMGAISGAVRTVPQGIDAAAALVANGANYIGQKAGLTENVPLSTYMEASPLNSALTSVIGDEYEPQTEGGKAIKIAAALISPESYIKGAGMVAKGAVGTAKAIDKTVGAGVKAAGQAGDITKTMLAGKNADEVFADIVKRSGMSPDELISQLKSGQITNIADIGGDNVQGLTRSVAKTAGGKDVVANELGQRAEGTSKRITQDINEGISKNTDYFGTLDDLTKRRSKEAGPLYQQAYAANKSIASPEVDKILATPAGRKALGDAVAIMQNDRSLVGVPAAELGEQARLAGLIAEGGVAEGLNLRTLDYVKKALDDQINTLQRAGENSKAAAIVGLKKDLVKELDAADVTAKAGPKSLKPEGGAYAQARKVSSDTYRLEEAQTAGHDFDKLQPQEIAKQLEAMGPAELDAYKIGVRQKLQQTVASNSDNASAPRKIFGNDLIRDKVRAVFGKDAEGYDKFTRRMQEEIRANKTNQRVLGGSRTDFNIDADSDFGEIVAQLPKKGLIGTAADAALGKITSFVSNRYYGINEANAKAIAKALVNREEGIKSLQKLLANQVNKNSPVSQAAKQAITAIQKGGSNLANPNSMNNKTRIQVTPKGYNPKIGKVE